MIKHTPGPWTFNEYTGSIDAPNKDGANVTVLFYTGERIEQNRADGRLIAAAPEMLEALMGFVYLFDGHTRTDAQDACVEEARAAIAKARGA